MSEIKLQRMAFEGILSYATQTSLSFDSHQVTQLIGRNGAGKSSIATILEEGLYNKNSRGIKKEALFNWNSDKKEYKIDIYFTKDGESYEVHKVVKSTAKLSLLKDGVDISGHTATQTYKLIEDIIGCDFTTFTKLIYQSVGSSLDFLKATDANRKQFLTTLLAQEHYKEFSEVVKVDVKAFKSDLDKETGKLAAIKQVIENAGKISPNMEILPEPEYNTEELTEELTGLKAKVVLVDEVEAKIRRRNDHNAKIDKRLKDLDKNVQAAEKSFEPFKDLTCAPVDVSEQLQSVTRELAVVSSQAETVKARYRGFKSQAEKTSCPTCGKPMDVSEAIVAAQIAREEYQPLYDRRIALEGEVEKLKQDDLKYRKFFKSKQEYDKAYSELQNFIDSGLSIKDETEYEVIDVSNYQNRINNINVQIRQQKLEIERIQEHNAAAGIHNAKQDTLREQLEKASTNLSVVQSNVENLQGKLSDLEILEKSFKDLIAYKLEFSVKAFEQLINSYLSVLTGGKFALGFELDATKLLVVIYNNGVKTTMESCSTGQQHRIQLSTLLAIRKLMSAISKVNINLLFLDEVISFLDVEGMNTLIELLLEEHDLNSFLVSHGMTHPLTHVLNIVGDEDGNSEVKDNV